MHELSIVEALIEQVEKEVQRSGQTGRVIGVELVVGRLSGVNTDSLRFAFDLLAPGTLVEAAEVRVAEPKATCRCRACGTGTEVDELVAQCPACGSGDVFLAGGRDLLLQSIHLED
ncbi:MAG: hydrogenase maturation nickel metallochaperone HypA [Planctomycetota bacterium]